MLSCIKAKLMNDRTYFDLFLGLTIPPVLTALYLLFVRVNNRYSLTQIKPQFWQTLFQLYCVFVFLTLMDMFRK